MTTIATPELVTIGEYLAGARTARGLSVQDVAHQTRIPGKHLLALESGNYETFDGIAYARSFLRLYGNYLDVDVTDALATLEERPDMVGEVNHYAFLRAPDKIRLASELIAPRPSRVPLATLLMALFLVLTLPVGFIVAKNYFSPGQETDTSSPAGDTTKNPGATGDEELESAVGADQAAKNSGDGDLQPSDESPLGIKRVPKEQLDRIRNPKTPEVRRAVIVDGAEDNDAGSDEIPPEPEPEPDQEPDQD